MEPLRPAQDPLTKKYKLARMLTSDPTRDTRRSPGRPVRSAPAASIAEPADSPPENRYAAIIQFHTGYLRTGRP